jgi:hypothetical protein
VQLPFVDEHRFAGSMGAYGDPHVRADQPFSAFRSRSAAA